MSNTTPSLFAKMLATDVSKHVEKKGKFAYLSWSYAVAELRKADPTATWTVQKFAQPAPNAGTVAPYCQTPAGCFVEVSVTCGGVTLSQIHPVIDERNQTVKTPNAYEVNKAIMRCLVKAIALHGLGLHVYAGEDLPLGDDGYQDAAVSEAQVQEKMKPKPPAFDMGPVLDLARAIIDGDAVALEWALKQIVTVVDDGPAGEKMVFALESLAEKRGAQLDDQEWRPAVDTADAVAHHEQRKKAAAYLEKKLAERDAEEKVLRIARGGRTKAQAVDHGRYASEFPNEGRSEG